MEHTMQSWMLEGKILKHEEKKLNKFQKNISSIFFSSKKAKNCNNIFLISMNKPKEAIPIFKLHLMYSKEFYSLQHFHSYKLDTFYYNKSFSYDETWVRKTYKIGVTTAENTIWSSLKAFEHTKLFYLRKCSQIVIEAEKEERACVCLVESKAKTLFFSPSSFYIQLTSFPSLFCRRCCWL